MDQQMENGQFSDHYLALCFVDPKNVTQIFKAQVA